MENNFNAISRLIFETAGTDTKVAINKVHMQFMESLEGGALLSQMIFFSDKSHRKDGYFYMSYKDWYNHLMISEHNVRKYVKQMKEMGFLETKLIKANSVPTLHYKFDVVEFWKVFKPFLDNLRTESEDIQNNPLNIYETLTEISTEISNLDINTLCTKEKEEADKKKSDKLEKEKQAKQIIELYKSLPNLPKVSIVTKQRLKTVIARINNKDIGFDRLKIALKKYNESDYLKGELEKGVNWYNFDFIFKEDKLARVLDGGYQNNKPKQQYNQQPRNTYENNIIQPQETDIRKQLREML